MFISSVNVCFNGEEIINGDERDHKWIECRRCLNTQYQESRICKHQTHLDTYSKSKQEAEKIVIADSKQVSNVTNVGENNKLNTCVLRYVIITSMIQKTCFNSYIYSITTLYQNVFFFSGLLVCMARVSK